MEKKDLNKLVKIREDVVGQNLEQVYHEGVSQFFEAIRDEVVIRGINEISIDINEYRSTMVTYGLNEYANIKTFEDCLKDLGYETWNNLEDKSYVLKVNVVDLTKGKMKKSKDYTDLLIKVLTDHANQYIISELEGSNNDK